MIKRFGSRPKAGDPTWFIGIIQPKMGAAMFSASIKSPSHRHGDVRDASTSCCEGAIRGEDTARDRGANVRERKGEDKDAKQDLIKNPRMQFLCTSSVYVGDVIVHPVETHTSMPCGASTDGCNSLSTAAKGRRMQTRPRGERNLT